MAKEIEDLGYFCERDSEMVRIGNLDETSEYKILKWNEFDSERKCSSVVIRRPDGKIFAYVKGSDSTLYNMLNVN